MESYPGAYPPHDAREDIAAIEDELARARRSVSGGQLAFDFFFGLVTPGLLLLFDPAVFTHDVAPQAAFGPHLALPAHVLAGVVGVALGAWLLSGARRPVLGILFAGPFAVGAIFSLLLAARLIGFGIGHADLLSGLLAITLWITVFVFIRQTARAVRAGADASAGLAGLSLVVGTVVVLCVFSAVARHRAERAEFLEALFLSDDEQDHERAYDLILESPIVDFDRLAGAYHILPDGDPRRPRIARSFFALTGEPIEFALRRLGRIPDEPPPEEQKPRPDAKAPEGFRRGPFDEPRYRPATDLSPSAPPRRRSGPRTTPRKPTPMDSPAAPAPSEPSETRRR